MVIIEAVALGRLFMSIYVAGLLSNREGRAGWFRVGDKIALAEAMCKVSASSVAQLVT